MTFSFKNTLGYQLRLMQVFSFVLASFAVKRKESVKKVHLYCIYRFSTYKTGENNILFKI